VPDQKPQDNVSITTTTNLKINSKVTVEATVTVVSKEEPGFIESKQIQILEMKIADASGSIHLTVWADIVDTLNVEHSYRLQDVTVREFRGSVPLRTETCYIRHFCVVFARLLCSAGITKISQQQ